MKSQKFSSTTGVGFSYNGQAYPTFANDRQLMLYEFIFNARNFYTLSCKCGETQASLFASAAGKRSYVQWAGTFS